MIDEIQIIWKPRINGKNVSYRVGYAGGYIFIDRDYSLHVVIAEISHIKMNIELSEWYLSIIDDNGNSTQIVRGDLKLCLAVQKDILEIIDYFGH